MIGLSTGRDGHVGGRDILRAALESIGEGSGFDSDVEISWLEAEGNQGKPPAIQASAKGNGGYGTWTIR